MVSARVLLFVLPLVALAAPVYSPCYIPYKSKSLNFTHLSHAVGAREFLYTQVDNKNEYVYINFCQPTTASCTGASVCRRNENFEFETMGLVKSYTVGPLSCSACAKTDRGLTFHFEGASSGPNSNHDANIHVVCTKDKPTTLKIASNSDLRTEVIIYDRVGCDAAGIAKLAFAAVLAALALLFAF